MAKTAIMRLVELMILKDDVEKIIEYLGKRKNFQFQNELSDSLDQKQNSAQDIFEKLQVARSYLNIADLHDYTNDSSTQTKAETSEAIKLLSAVDELKNKETKALENIKRTTEAYQEALAFANLKVPYSELEHLSFLTLRIGKIDPSHFDVLQFSLAQRAVIIPLGEDKTKILAATSKKGRFALDSELKRFGFVDIEIAKNFQGIPDDIIQKLAEQTQVAKEALSTIEKERMNYADTHAQTLLHLLQSFSIGMQVQTLRNKLESTQMVYRITGWIPEYDIEKFTKDLDKITSGRIAITQYVPEEVPTVRDGYEKVPVKLKHGKFVSSFERLVFSYGAPLYGTIDPTPLVAFFFTLLFGIMFGDLGQGLVFLLVGILLANNIITIKGWNKFGPIFIGIGISSSFMGLLTGEFFANGNVLKPFSRFVTGLFGEPRSYILHLMPSGGTLDKLFMFFLFTIAVGFIINSIGLVINIANQFLLKKYGNALFGKTGLSGALFFWYVVFMIIRVFALKSTIMWWDWAVIAITLFGVFMAHPLERLVEGHKPIFKNGFGIAFIEGLVEILEVVSSYLSNSVSFLRVGAFALAHAVLGTIIFTLTDKMADVHFAGGVFVMILGNAVVIILEGMIVAIQVIRLHYYEFFSKFFTETGKEFKPFEFQYKDK
ncbi:MAG: V-type ATP synthase subunit I [Treponemataceae bacterium]